MSEEHSHLTTTGDEATEARIIAWVLGEASAFEAAELQVLCEQTPELQVFHRRLLALHECLKDAHAPAIGEDWKLPTEKRGKLDELIGPREKTDEVHRKPRRRWWVNAAAIAALIMLQVVIGLLATGSFNIKNRISRVLNKESEKPQISAVESEMLRYRDDERNLRDLLPSSNTPVSAGTPKPRSRDASLAGEELVSDRLEHQVLKESFPMEVGTASASAVAASAPDALAAATQSEASNDKTIASGGFVSSDGTVMVGKNAEGRQSRVTDQVARNVYEQALQLNPDDHDARRGLEELAKENTDYYRAEYDQSRAKLLASAEKTSERPMPAEGEEKKERAQESVAKGEKGAAIIAGTLSSNVDGWSGTSQDLAKVSEADSGFAGGSVPVGEKLDGSDQSTWNKPSALAARAPQNLPMIVPVEKKMKASLPASHEITTAEEPYSTFSLRVSDNSFRIAQAAMAQNQRPAADSVRVEEFYNAFDYGDPIPTAQEPVTASMEQSAHPILPQRNLLRIALRTASIGRSAGQPLRLTLLVDQSGSMNRNDRRSALLASIQELSRMLTEQDQISVIGFSRTPRLLAEKIPGNETQRLLEIVRAVPSDGGTNLEEALKLGEVVAKRNQIPNAQNRLLLFTDGAANLGNADPARLSDWVKQLRQKNLSFDIAGIGMDGLNDPLLVEIARHGNGRYYVTNDATQAKEQFANQIAGAFRPVAENVKVQVRFNPQRVSRYQLIGFEKDRLRTEDFRNDRVDAAEMAAAEAGQALYQIELLPEGKGDIGEVSVRFRDVATQQMVERKWTIRHDTTTPVFDRASPTMQLAGLSMLSAQKLQGGDVASMIRFAELQEPRRRLREIFSQSQRVGELLQMIDQIQE